jgi:hypothetical protein
MKNFKRWFWVMSKRGIPWKKKLLEKNITHIEMSLALVGSFKLFDGFFF